MTEDEKDVVRTIEISVRNLVEFVLQSGDLDNRRLAASSKNAMEAGSEIHGMFLPGGGDSEACGG